jgi:hypothetical protein
MKEGEISLRDIFLLIKEVYTYLLSKWLVISLAFIIGGTLGVVYASKKKPVYSSACTFVLEDGGGGGRLGQYSGLASMVGIDLGSGGGGIFQGDNIIELYKSRTMIEKTLLSEIKVSGRGVLLIDVYLNSKNLRKTWAKDPTLSKLTFGGGKDTFTRLQDSVLGIVINDIKKNYLIVAKPDKKLSIIKVEVKASDENFSKFFNDLIVKNVNDFYVKTKTKKSLENVEILQQKTDSVRAVMNGAIYAAVAVSDATPNLNPTRQIQRVAPMQRAQFSAETNKTILGELVKNLEMSKIALRNETPLIQVIDKPVFPLESEKFSKLRGLAFGGLLTSSLVIGLLLTRRLYNRVCNDQLEVEK